MSSSATWTSVAHLPAEEAFEPVVAITAANGPIRFYDGLGTPLG